MAECAFGQPVSRWSWDRLVPLAQEGVDDGARRTRAAKAGLLEAIAVERAKDGRACWVRFGVPILSDAPGRGDSVQAWIEFDRPAGDGWVEVGPHLAAGRRVERSACASLRRWAEGASRG